MPIVKIISIAQYILAAMIMVFVDFGVGLLLIIMITEIQMLRMLLVDHLRGNDMKYDDITTIDF